MNSWDSELFQIFLDGAVVKTLSYHVYNFGGFLSGTAPSWPSHIEKVLIEVDHNKEIASLAFSSTLD